MLRQPQCFQVANPSGALVGTDAGMFKGGSGCKTFCGGAACTVFLYRTRALALTSTPAVIKDSGLCLVAGSCLRDGCANFSPCPA